MIRRRRKPDQSPTTYILTVDPGKTPEQDDFYSCYLRAQARDWPVVIIESDHNAQRSHPQEIVRLFEQARQPGSEPSCTAANDR